MTLFSRIKSRLRRNGVTEVEVPYPPGAASTPQQTQQFVMALSELAIGAGGRVTTVPVSFSQPIKISFPTREAAKEFKQEAARVV